MNYSVLVVEDDITYQSILTKLIKDDSRLELIDIASDSMRAALSINKYKPDILILDVEISGLNGFEIFDILDYQPITIVISSKSSYKNESIKMGAAGFLQKPFRNLDDFNSKINYCISTLNATA